jgi:hypothetical protein
VGILSPVRALAATGALAVAAAAFTGSADAHGFSARVAAGLAAARAPLSQLEQVSATRSFGTTFVRVRQRVGGIPVLGSAATLTLGSDGGRLLLDHTRATVGRPLPARLSRGAALLRAREFVGVQSLRAPARASLAIAPRPSRLVWRTVLPSARPLGDFEVLVDARSGAVLRTRNLIERAAGQALVFDPNPVVEQGSRTGLVDANDADSPALNALYRKVALQDLDPAGCLRGLWVAVAIGRGATCPSSNQDFSAVTRGSACKCFEAAMAYFHIDRMQRYLQTLGFSDVVHRAIPVNLHATSADNSFYSPSTGSLNFGDGGVNDAQDADVISHEYGHAIQDSQASGFGVTTEGGTVAEGWGDYWEAAMSANSGNADVFNTCFAEWDTSSITDAPLPCLRRVDQQWTLQQAYSECGNREIHCVGQAWSNTLWTIRAELGAAAADRLIVQSQFSYSEVSGFRDASLALLFADRGLNDGANQDFLQDLLLARGFLKTTQLDDEPAGAAPLEFPGQVSGTAGISDDERDVLAVSLPAGTGVVFQAHATGDAFYILELYAPNTLAIEGSTAVARTQISSLNPKLAYVPPSAGTYYLAITADSGDGTYTVSALPDADRDGFSDQSDNCVATPNPSQADWNRNGKGDACDRAARTTIVRVAVHGHVLTVTGSLLPADAAPADWVVQVRAGSGKLVAGTRGARSKGAGRVVAVVRVPATVRGRVSVRAVLQDHRYNRVASKPVSVTLS